jgi:hypothetical protein
LPAATTSIAGLLTSTDKTKLDGIAAGAQVNVATNLGNSVNATSVTVTSSTGTNTTLPAATTSNAGVFVAADKTKLDGIAAGAQVNVATNLGYTTAASTGTVTSSTGTDATLPAATTSLAGLLTGADKTKLDGIAAGAQVNVATNLTYSTAATTGTVNSSTGTNATIPAATTSLAGLMTNADKTKLDGIAAGAQVNVGTDLGITGTGDTRTVTSSTGTNVTIPVATTTTAGWLSTADKTKLDGIQAGAQVNVATNLSVTGGTTAGPTINSSTGTNATIPTASASASGAVTTGDQTFAGTKTFSAAVVLSTAGTTTTQAVRADRTLTAGTGLTGGGNLTADRTFNIDIATQAEAEDGTNNTKVITPLRIRSALNAAGSAPVFACRSWVNFNGTTSPGTIRGSGNVSSVTRNSTGVYTVNFTTAMQDENYGVALAATNTGSRGFARVVTANQTASSSRIDFTDVNGGNFNQNLICFAAFR